LGDDHRIFYEDGSYEVLKPHHFVVPFGKYKDMKISDIQDTSYLKWLKTSNEEKKPIDWFMAKIIDMRLKELGA